MGSSDSSAPVSQTPNPAVAELFSLLEALGGNSVLVLIGLTYLLSYWLRADGHSQLQEDASLLAGGPLLPSSQLEMAKHVLLTPQPSPAPSTVLSLCLHAGKMLCF